MTIVEQLVQIVHALGAEDQRRVLAVAAKLHDAQKLPEISLAGVDLSDDAAWDGWNERIRDRSALMLEAEGRRLRAICLSTARAGRLSRHHFFNGVRRGTGSPAARVVTWGS